MTQNKKVSSQLFFAQQSRKLLDAERVWRNTKKRQKGIKKEEKEKEKEKEKKEKKEEEKEIKYTVFGINFYDLINR